MTGARRARAAIAACLCLGLVYLASPPPGAADPGPSTIAVVPGEVIVRFNDGAGASARSAALPATAVRAAKALPVRGMKLLEINRGQSVRGAIAALEAQPSVAYAEPNYVRTLRATPDDPSFGALWGLRNIGAPIAWNETTGSDRVTIAVVDDGVDLTHPDLERNIWRKPGESGDGRESNSLDDDDNGLVDDWRGWDFADGDNAPRPEIGVKGAPAPHGTHVAGILGAVGDNGIGTAGVNWTTAIMPLRIFDRAATTTTARIVRAFGYAARNGARALNASFGGDTSSRAEHDAIAASPNTLFIVAAPNERVNIDTRSDYPCAYELANVVCVTASDRSGAVAAFAARGKRTVDLAAPGVGILSTVPGGYDTLSGTSMSAPHVAGAAGLIAAARPKLSAAKIKAALLRSARRNRATKRQLASGRLDLRRAIVRALSKGKKGKGKPKS